MSKIESIDYVVGIGTANVDIYAKSLIPLKEKYDHPSKISTSVGGVTRNILCNLSLLGVKTKLLNAVGDDVYGKKILDDCIHNNIDISNVLKISNESSNIFMQILDDHNDIHMAFCDMAINKHITIEYLKSKESIIKNSKAIIIDPSLPNESIEYLVNYFGHKIYVDPISDSYASKIKPYIPKIFAIKPNKTELEVLSDIKINNDEDLNQAIKKVLNLGVKHLFVSLGEKGAMFCVNEKIIKKRFHPVENMVNASGAGDSFFATMIYGDIKGFNEEETLELSLAAGIMTVQSSETISTDLSIENLRKIVIEEKNKLKK